MLWLRSRFRAIINSKQTRMAEHSTQTSSPDQNQSTPLSSFMGSPRFFGGLLSWSISDEIPASPSSILDTNQFCNYSSPFGYGKSLFKTSPISTSPDNSKHLFEKKGIGLALIPDNEKEDFDSFPKPNSKMVLFGGKLKVQIPLVSNSCDDGQVVFPLGEVRYTDPLSIASKSPTDFGIKTRNSRLLRSLSVHSPCIRGKDDQEGLSLSEMELSEEYTCVMTHGPNPKTTHIFDDTIVDSCCGVGNLSDLKKEDYRSANDANVTSLPVDFLGFCYTCKVKLEDGKDFYMYRGEKAFCSHECRFQEMLMEEDVANNSNLDDASCRV